MKRSKSVCDGRSCFACRHSLEAWLPLIHSHKQNRSFRKGDRIFEEGGQVTGIYFIYSGAAKVHKRWGKQKELIIHFAKEGDMIGYRGLGQQHVYPVSATALDALTVCFIDLSFFESNLQVNHPLAYQLMKFYASELLEAEKRMRNLALMDVKGRVADTLLTLATTFGVVEAGHINVALTRQDMASYAGTTYETFFRAIQDLVTEKLIVAAEKKFTIIDEKGLRALTMERW